jgi:hypothetical protein
MLMRWMVNDSHPSFPMSEPERAPERVTGNANGLLTNPLAPPPTKPDGPPDREMAAWLSTAAQLLLDRPPASPAAQALVAALDQHVEDHEKGTRIRQRSEAMRQKRADGLGRIVGSLLREWCRQPARPVWHLMKTKLFTGGPVPYRQFTGIMDSLQALQLVRSATGKSVPPIDWDEGVRSWEPGLATRYWPAPALLDLAAAHGVTPSTVGEDFPRRVEVTAKAVEPSQLVKLTSFKTYKGSKAPLRFKTDDPEVVRIQEEVEEANAFATECSVHGCAPPRWYRVFTADWRLGGRWIATGAEGNYQQMAEEDRLAITINGEPAAEVDVSASHLSIMHGLLGLQLPEGDLYDVPGIPRDVVKAWITATLGKGSSVKKWGGNAAARTGGYNAQEVGRAICASYPFLQAPARAVEAAVGLDQLRHLGTPEKLLTHRLMNIEADAMTKAMHAFTGWEGPRTYLALPLHDSLIVPAKAAKTAASCIRLSFDHVARVRVRLHVDGPEA